MIKWQSCCAMFALAVVGSVGVMNQGIARADEVPKCFLVGEESYETFAAARDVLPEEGGTIVLGCDTTGNGYYGVSKDITLDLNGHSYVANTAGFQVTAGTFTVNDTVGSGVVQTVSQGVFVKDGGTVVINGGKIVSTASYGVYASGNGAVVVNGGEVTATGENRYGIIGSGADVMATMNGGKVSSERSMGAVLLNGATLTVNGGEVMTGSATSSAVYLDASGLVMEDGSITAPNSTSAAAINVKSTNGAVIMNGGTVTGAAYGISVFEGSTVTMNGGEVNSKYMAISGNNTIGDMNVYINGGTVTSTGFPAIYMPSQVDLIVKDGTLNGGVLVRMGQVKVSGGIINATESVGAVELGDTLSNDTLAYAYSGGLALKNAISVLGGAYTSANETYGNSLNLEISGGALNAPRGSAVAVYDLGKTEQEMHVAVSGGTLNAAENKDALMVAKLGEVVDGELVSGYGVSYQEAIDTTISGGVFGGVKMPSTKAIEYVAEGKTAYEIEQDGAWAVLDEVTYEKEDAEPIYVAVGETAETGVTVTPANYYMVAVDGSVSYDGLAMVGGLSKVAGKKTGRYSVTVTWSDAEKTEKEFEVVVYEVRADVTAEEPGEGEAAKYVIELNKYVGEEKVGSVATLDTATEVALEVPEEMRTADKGANYTRNFYMAGEEVVLSAEGAVNVMVDMPGDVVITYEDVMNEDLTEGVVYENPEGHVAEGYDAYVTKRNSEGVATEWTIDEVTELPELPEILYMLVGGEPYEIKLSETAKKYTTMQVWPMGVAIDQEMLTLTAEAEGEAEITLRLNNLAEDTVTMRVVAYTVDVEAPEEMEETVSGVGELIEQVLGGTTTEAGVCTEQACFDTEELKAAAKEALATGEELVLSTELVSEARDTDAYQESEEYADVTEEMKETETVAAVYDGEIQILLNGSKVGQIYELATPVRLELEIPEGYREAAEGKVRSFAVIHRHVKASGAVETERFEGEALERNGNKLAFSTSKFSSFVIAYADVDEEGDDAGDDDGGSGDDSGDSGEDAGDDSGSSEDSGDDAGASDADMGNTDGSETTYMINSDGTNEVKTATTPDTGRSTAVEQNATVMSAVVTAVAVGVVVIGVSARRMLGKREK